MVKQKISSLTKVSFLTSQDIECLGESSHSICILKEAKRLQLKQQRENAKLIEAAKLRGDLRR